MNNQVLIGRSKQLLGRVLCASGKWLGSYRLIRVGRRFRNEGYVHITIADARAVIRRCMRRTPVSN